jgi:hypothetical protein
MSKSKQKKTPKSVEELTEAFLNEYDWENFDAEQRLKCSLRAKAINDALFNRVKKKPLCPQSGPDILA